jgi:hypothetical protein
MKRRCDWALPRPPRPPPRPRPAPAAPGCSSGPGVRLRSSAPSNFLERQKRLLVTTSDWSGNQGRALRRTRVSETTPAYPSLRRRPTVSRRARKAQGWPKICHLAHAFLWEHSHKRLKLAQLLGRFGIFLTQPADAGCAQPSGFRLCSDGVPTAPPSPACITLVYTLVYAC